MKNSLVLAVFLWALWLPLVLPMDKVTIPAALKSAVVKVAVNSTPCSVTCGLGVRLEELCEITPAGERKNCTTHTSSCLTNWICGLLHFTIPAGKPFQISCLTSDVMGLGSQAYKYTWRLAQGLVTTNDVLFNPFRNPSPDVRLSPAKESDAGTYRCDVQMRKTFKVIKRVYFGVRVIQSDLVDLNFQKSLTWEQKLTANKEKGNTESNTWEEAKEQQLLWQELLYECLVGVGSGVIAGVLVSVAVYFVQKKLRRRAVENQTEL